MYFRNKAFQNFFAFFWGLLQVLTSELVKMHNSGSSAVHIGKFVCCFENETRISSGQRIASYIGRDQGRVVQSLIKLLANVTLNFQS